MPTPSRSKTGTARAGAGRRFPTSSSPAQTGPRRSSAGRSASRTRRPATGRRNPTSDLGLSSALRKRKTPKRTGVSKTLTGLMSGGATKKAASSSKKGKGGGLAMLAAGAGLAFKNREKLMGMVKSREEEPATPLTTTNSTAPVASIDDRPDSIDDRPAL